jgi:hypothetical protein
MSRPSVVAVLEAAAREGVGWDDVAGVVTLKLLHGEYVDRCRARGELAMGYDRFCKNYQQYVLVNGGVAGSS